jgi:NADH:ubiquinone oxidoreductase subunit K
LIEGISISLALITVTSQNVASSTVCGTVSASVIAFIVLTVWAQSDVNIGTQSSSSVEELLGWVWVADA